MPIEVIIPSLGEVVEEVTILQWFKKERDPVRKGEALLEVESEKVNTAIESPASGFLGKILYPQGAKVAITKVVAIILAEGEKLPEAYQTAVPESATQPTVPTAGDVHGGERTKERTRVAPVARRMAEKEGIDLLLVKPTGPHGTIMKKDVEAYLASRTMMQEERGRAGFPESSRTPEVEKVPVSAPAVRGRKVELTSVRKTIARRMVKSASAAPHLILFHEVGMDALLEMREVIKASYKNPEEFQISINDFLLKATALALREYPYLNARWENEEIFLMENINIGLAVSLEEGLIVPAIPDVDRLGLEEIARQRIELVEKARQGKLQRIELDRGTFTITSLASFGVSHFTAIINPPQSAIMSVGATQEKLVLTEGKVNVRRFAVLGLAVDHRVADGAYGAKFLESLRRKLENPFLTFLHL